MNETLAKWIDPEHLANWIIMSIFTLGSIGFYLYNRWVYRDMPRTREERLEMQIADMKKYFDDQVSALTKQISDRDEQINILLDDRMHDRKRIRALELSDAEKTKRIAELEREIEQAQSRPSRGARTAGSYTPKKLNNDQRKALRSCLLDAYPTRDDWVSLLQDVEHPLDLVALGDSLTVIADKVLTQAQAGGWLEHLMTEAAEQRPQLTALQELVDALLKTLAPDAN